MTPSLDEYDYLWNGTQSGWVLLRSNAGDEDAKYVVYNEQRSRMLLIEDSEVQRLVCEQLLSRGVKVLAEVPKREFDVANLDIVD